MLAFRAGGFFPGTTAWLAIGLSFLVVLRITLAPAPLAGWGRGLTVLAGALGLLAVMTLLSSLWSDAPARAILEFDRVLVYLLVVILAGMGVRRPGDLAAVLRWTALALALAATAGLLSRLLPSLLPTQLGFDPARLAFPVTYWNAMGILGAIALVLLAATCGAREEPTRSRLLAAAATPAVAGALLLTFSRGGVGAAALGLLALVAARPSRTWLLVAPALAIPSAALVLVLLGADRVTSDEFATGAAAGERRSVLVALAGCTLAATLLAAAALRLDRRWARAAPRPRTGRGARPAIAGGTAVVAAVALIAAGAPAWVDDQRRAFAAGDIVPLSDDPASRLTQVGNNGRLAMWRVALDRFAAEPWHGDGAGTYRLAWQRDRPPQGQTAVDGHSLYLEALAELGLAGLALVVVALGTVLWAAARGLGEPEGMAHAALLAAGLALLVHAGIDWDWEMPVLWVWFFAAGAVALRRPDQPRRAAGATGRMVRVVAGLGVLLVALTPWSVARSQARLSASTAAFEAGDCRAASRAALDSLHAMSSRPEPLEVLGYCNLRAGRDRLAVDTMRAAVQRDPGAWEYRYGLAVALGIAGGDPRPELAAARARNPQEPIARDLEAALERSDRERWPRVAGRAAIPGL